ncbi:MAG TPA: hypothetical protein VJ777_20075 [Mycobacterium sp.]|nr:hypothetical protein [Mycobacterium sp.]
MTITGERIVLTRWSPLMALGVLAVTAVLAAGPLFTLLSGAGTRGEQIFMAILAAIFAIPLLWTLWRLPKVLRGMGIAVDETGIHPFDGKASETITWSQIAAIGFGSHARTYRGLKTKTMAGLEIYVKGANAADCLRYTVSPYGKDAELIERAVKRFHPELWGGPFLHER